MPNLSKQESKPAGDPNTWRAGPVESVHKPEPSFSDTGVLFALSMGHAFSSLLLRLSVFIGSFADERGGGEGKSEIQASSNTRHTHSDTGGPKGTSDEGNCEAGKAADARPWPGPSET